MAGTGLRERKRERTRRAIARAALDLFDRQGFHETTIPQIAEAADVSPRTVSSYFPAKEDLAFPDADEAMERLERRLRAREPGETAADALRAFIVDWLPERAARADEARTQRRVINATPSLLDHEHRFMRRAQDAIAAAIAADLEADPADLEPRMAAAATVTMFEVLEEHLEPAGLLDPGERGEPRAEVLELLDRALVFIGGGVRALRGEPRP